MKQANWFDAQAQTFENGRFGLMTILMTAQSCWGSIAAMFALKADNFGLLMVITAFTMASNSAFIAQAPAKWCLGIFYSAVIVNSIAFIALLLM